MGLKIVWRGGWAHAQGTIAGIGRIREGLGTRDPAQAEELRAALEARLHRERVFGRESVVTFDEAVEKYALAKLDEGKAIRFLDKVLPKLRGRALKDITSGVLKDIARELYPNASASTRRRQVITPTAAVINYVAEEYKWCHPIKIRYPKGPEKKKVAISYDWVDVVRAECAKRKLWHLSALTLFFFQTGFRVGEAVKLTPDDFHPDQMAVVAGVTKNGEPRVMALTPEMVFELKRLKPRPGYENHLFGYSTTFGVRQGYRRVCKGAGVPYLGTHQPGRHSFATALEGLGMTPKSVADAGGWKTVKVVTDVYLHPDEPASRAARMLSRWGGADTNLAQPPAPNPEEDASPGDICAKKEAVHEARPKFREETPVGRV